MEIVVRPARPEDPCVPLLYASSQPYYDAYAGTEARALALLRAVFPRPGHAASYELCHVAEAGGELAGVLAGFPVPAGDRLPPPGRPAPGPPAGSSPSPSPACRRGAGPAPSATSARPARCPPTPRCTATTS